MWCHNPESQAHEPQILFYPEKCIYCGRCGGVTTKDVNFKCYNGAKYICGKEMDVEEVEKAVMQDKMFYSNSGGGITLSGGEPMSQFEFSLELTKKLKGNGIHTAIETSGYSKSENIEKISEYTDLFLFDYKETNPELHKKITGSDNELILSNLMLINSLKKEVILRCPIVPNYNDRAEHFEGIARIADRLECIKRVEVMPYHSFGQNKYGALGRNADEINVPNAKQKKYWFEEISKRCIKEVVLQTADR